MSSSGCEIRRDFTGGRRGKGMGGDILTNGHPLMLSKWKGDLEIIDEEELMKGIDEEGNL